MTAAPAAAGRAAARAGSVKVRHTARGITIRATGAAAQVLAGALRKTLDTAPGTPYKTVRFADQGQDVLEWDIDANQVVTDSRPYQSQLWVGTQVLGAIAPGRTLVFMHPRDGIPHGCCYPVEAITEGRR